METSPSITVLSTHPERPAISQGGCRLNVLLRLNAPPLARTHSERQPVALAVVIDRSGWPRPFQRCKTRGPIALIRG